MVAWRCDSTNDFHSRNLAVCNTVANVPDAETQFQAHEFLDVTVQPKPIYISPNEVYSMHTLLSQYQDDLVSPLFMLSMNNHIDHGF